MSEIKRISDSEQSTVSQFTREKLQQYEDRVRLVDTDEESGLDLFCYNRCDNDDDPFVQNCRGLVFHQDKLIMKSFPYTPEYNQTDLEPIKKIITNFANWKFYLSHEGALIRMFFFAGRWFITTHRKLNAYRSKWSSKDSFGNLFERAIEAEKEKLNSYTGQTTLEKFQNSLDPNVQYMFLLRNVKENRIVCEAPENPPFVFFVGGFRNFVLDPSVSTVLQNPELIHPENLEELCRLVSSLDYTKLQGVIGFGDGQQIKILNDIYQELFRARGNEPSIKFRYLQVRMNQKQTKLLYQLYPEMAKEFDEYENILYNIAERILKDYLQRFVYRRYITVPREDFAIIRECHEWHQQDRARNRISVNKVITVMNKQPATSLNAMIRRYKIDASGKIDLPPRDVKGSKNNSPAITALAGPVAVLKRLQPPKLN